MKTLRSYSFVFCLLLFWACNSNDSNNYNLPSTDNTTSNTKDLVVPWAGELEIRAKPIMKSSVLAKVKKNEPVTLTGEITGFRDTITLKGKTFIEPWVKVKTKKGRIGWIFRGAVKRPGE